MSTLGLLPGSSQTTAVNSRGQVAVPRDWLRSGEAGEAPRGAARLDWSYGRGIESSAAESTNDCS